MLAIRRTIQRRSALLCLLLFMVATLRSQSLAQGAATAPPGTVIVSDAAYAEVSALSYAALHQAALALRDALNNASSQETPMILLTGDLINHQLALRAAIVQLDAANEALCHATQATTPPATGTFRPQSSIFTGDIGSIASGAASVAQLFTPHTASSSVALAPSQQALLADLLGAGRPILLPDTYLPSSAELAPDPATLGAPCTHTFTGASPTAVQTFPTLWAAASTTASQLRTQRKPTDDAKAAIAAWDDLAKTYLTPNAANATAYAQLLQAQALSHFLDPALSPVLVEFGVDAMGGTTSEGGKTSFTSHTRYSAGVVIHYLAWQLRPNGPMHAIAAGTITRTLSNQSETDVQGLINR